MKIQITEPVKNLFNKYKGKVLIYILTALMGLSAVSYGLGLKVIDDPREGVICIQAYTPTPVATPVATPVPQQQQQP